MPATPSGFDLPTGTVTSGGRSWNLIHAEDFTTDAALGAFKTTAPYSTWFDYYDVSQDTAKVGTWNGDKTISVSGGCLLVTCHTESGTPYAAVPVMRAAPNVSYGAQTYGRYSVAMRVVPTGDTSGWYVVPLLWPASDQWPDDGEIDWPETGLAGSAPHPNAYMHYAQASGGQDAFEGLTSASMFDWHVYTTEWTAGKVVFYVDGTAIGTSTTHVPSKPMYWALQCETNNGITPAASSIAQVQFDWTAMWCPA